MPRRKAKSYYLEAYWKFANRLERDDNHFVNQARDTKGKLLFEKATDGKNDDPTRPVITESQDVSLRSGWPTDPSLMPIFLTEDEATVTPGWQDYNRLTFSVTFLPAGTGTTRSFILVQCKVLRPSYFSYTPAADDQTYDLTKPPIKRRLTRAQEERYWSELPSPESKVVANDLKRYAIALGVSPDGFLLGSTSAQKVDLSKASYFMGVALTLNPYASVHVGATTSDGRHFRLAIGFGLDVDIISKIFGGSK